jgi:double-stranded uracil-DNA glycosylase
VTPRDPADWSTLRLKDRITPDVRVLFVGINPGVRSAVTGHHFAGFSNRFWKLLFESGLVPEAIGHQDDGRLPEFGYGITNLIARPSPGINDLRPIEYVEGWKILERKIRRYRPELVALIGVTLYRAILPLLRSPKPLPKNHPVELGAQSERIHGARIFVLPNPSGRNANFTYAEMLEAFRRLERESRVPKGS